MPLTLEKKAAPGHDTRRRIESKLTHLMANGFWFCADCKRVTDRVEGENGQPAHCLHANCKSYRIHFQKAIL